MPKYFVIREVGGDDHRPFVVARHGAAFEGKWERKVLFLESQWYEKEDDARAHAHGLLYPDYA